MADPNYRYVDNNPTATAEANATALAGGTAVDSQGNKITGFGTPAPTPTPTSPYVNGKDPTGGLTPGYTLTNGQLTYTGTNTNGQTTVDPITQYYQNLADPSVANQSLRDSINKAMNDALAGIDQKYVQIYADRLGQTRSINARSGTQGSDFGAAAIVNTQTTTDQQKSAEQAAVRANYDGQLNQLAQSEIEARQANELGKANAAQASYEKNKTDAQALIIDMAKTGQTLTDAQKQVLLRNSGYDDATFELVYNANKPAAQKISYTYDKDAHAFYGVDPATGKLSIVKDTSYSPDADIVLEIMKKYPDAGITLKDDLATAQGKISNSSIYKKDITPPVTNISYGQQKDETAQTLLTAYGPQLQASRGADGYVDPAKYLELATQFAAQTTNPQLFEQTYLGLVNPKDRAQVSGKIPTPTASENNSEALNSVLTKYNIKSINDLTDEVISNMPLSDLQVIQNGLK